MSARGLSDDLAWAIRLVRLGHDEQAIVQAISRRHPRHGYNSLVFAQNVDERGLEAAKRYARRTARKAFEITKGEPRVQTPDEARERLIEIHSYVDVEPWPVDRAGARRALEAAVLVGLERGRVVNLGLDIRTHSLRAGQSFKAVRQHRSTLHRLGWLKRNPHDRGARTSRFSFHVPGKGTLNRPSVEVLQCAQVHLSHDAWRDLGDRAWLEWWCYGKFPALPSRNADPDEITFALDLIALRASFINTGWNDYQRYKAERAAQSLNVSESRAVPHAS